ncbi:MAG: hypothetical protein IKJ65_05470 [Clostridia bacterium]|nr:hypothetical protein [Clostridia bacterium]
MLEIVEAEARTDMCAFFKAAKDVGYLKKEEKYLRRYAVPPLSLLSQNGPQFFLIAKRDGKPVFRALTGVDWRYIQKEKVKTGYFSLFDGEKDREACTAVLDAILKKQRDWGMDEVIGPISPDGSGFFMGAGEGDFGKERGAFTGPDSAFACGILRESGFAEKQVENAYEISLDGKNPLFELTRKAEERFRVNVARMETGVFSDAWIRNILAVSKHAPERELRLLLERIRPFIDKKHSYTAFMGGACAGYLVSLKSGKEGVLRATTLITSADCFSAPAALCLIGRYLEDAKKRGVRSFEISVINSQNVRSERLALRYGARKIRSYTLFTKKVGQN